MPETLEVLFDCQWCGEPINTSMVQPPDNMIAAWLAKFCCPLHQLRYSRKTYYEGRAWWQSPTEKSRP